MATQSPTRPFDQWSLDEVRQWVQSWSDHKVNPIVINKVLSSVETFQINGMTLLCISKNDLTMDLGFSSIEANILIERRDYLYKVAFHPNQNNETKNVKKVTHNLQSKESQYDSKQNDTNAPEGRDNWNEGYPLKSTTKQIYICLQKGYNEFKIRIDSTKTVGQLKQLYINTNKSKLSNDKYNEIVLLYMGKILDENQTLENYCIGYKKITYIFVAQKMTLNKSSKPTPASGPLEDTSTSGELVGILFINKYDNSEHVIYVEPNVTFLQLKGLYKDYLLKQSKLKQQNMEIIQLLKLNIVFDCSGMVFSDKKLLTECGIGQTELQYIFVSFTKEMNDEQKEECLMKKYQITSTEHKILTNTTEQFNKSCKSSLFIKSVKSITSKFITTSKHQLEQTKAFHDIQDIVKEQTSKDRKKADIYTQKILSNTACGTLGSDVNITLKIINGIFKSIDDECLFYDSRKGIKLMGGDSSCGMHEMFQKDKPFILRLKTLNGLYGVTENEIKNDKKTLIEMQSAINNNIQHPTLTHVVNKLSAALAIDSKRIHMHQVFAGSDCFKYSINNLKYTEKQRIMQNDPSGRLRTQFHEFLELKIHPLLFRPAFDVAMFDKRGNKSFISGGSTFKIGPTNNKKTYTQPKGWTRYGLKVLNKFGDDKWLKPFKDPGNWWRAFHGTKNAYRHAQEGIGQNDAAIDQLANNYEQFRVSSRFAAYGVGVYCSPDPVYIDNDFAGKVAINIRENGNDQEKNFKFMLQVAVRPGNNTLTPKSTDTIWSVRNNQDIRAYGILIKEV